MIKLELEINEVNMILALLDKYPFGEVASLIVKIKQQGDPQALALEAQNSTEQQAASVETAASV